MMQKPIIEFKNFTFKYRTQKEPTLVDINLTIYENEKILIVGPSGSGKSTLAHCINGLVPFSYEGDIEGSLTIKGQETKDLDIFTIAKTVGTVLQDPDGQFIGLSVGEDIAFSLENECVPQDEMKQTVVDTAKLVNMENYLHSSLHELSGGQRQRVSLAGVLVDQVDVLLFDEPLANLDPATGQHAISLIDDIQKETNITTIIVEHRLEDVLHRHVDRIIVINDGKIISDSSPDELLSSTTLEKIHIREPLYVKALKYAGCQLTPDKRPAYIETLDVNAYKKELNDWFETTDPSRPIVRTEPILQLKDVSFKYAEDGPTILKDVNFTIDRGEMVSIIGPNGAGKSTLSKVICGFEKNQTGSLYLNGENITNDTIFERAERIGMVMQNPNHMISKHMIFDEVAFGLQKRNVPEAEIKERVYETLKVCGLYPFRNWPISALSFGQRKRVTIASILVLNPEIIILDEPTAGQDLRHYTEIMEFLLKLNEQGVTVLMVTHDMHLMLEYTPRALVVAKQGIYADAPAVDIITDPTIIETANLKETSLFDLAKRADIAEPREFVARFIDYDREVRETWR